MFMRHSKIRTILQEFTRIVLEIFRTTAITSILLLFVSYGNSQSANAQIADQNAYGIFNLWHVFSGETVPGFTLEGSGKLTVDEGGAIFDNRSDFTPLLSLGSVNIVNNGLIEKAEYIEPLLQTFIGSRTTLDNRGTIRSSGSAFNLDGGFFWLENSGTITSRDHAIFWAQSSGDLDDEKKWN